MSVYEGSTAETTVEVGEAPVENAALVQTGYVVSIESPVEATADITGGAVTKTVTLQKGTTRFCMSGKQYRLTLHTCFEMEEVIVSADHTSVVLTPTKYRMEGTFCDSLQLKAPFCLQTPSPIQYDC